jgi:WD40 repeat protein/serine/threonine protein kinase
MSGYSKKKGDKSEKKGQVDFPTLSLPGSGELSDSPTALLGTRIGSYKLVSILGEGGFGIVYRAEQEEPVRREVALKIIKPGMDSIQVIGRFEAERQALAWLDHPNIAHIYDGGTTEAGRPYFVMEYVEGTPITEYCDEQKLSIKERLELFEQVCKAAQHAHQKGIIHRDIKPSNVLVSLQDDKPVPKIIDFGIAKAVSQSSTEQTFTEKGQFIGTTEYTSPEQATLNNQDIDTRSDIYSLGVLLYELLTGTLPFESDMLHRVAFDESLRIIREEDPPRPSACLSGLGEEAQKIAQCRQTEVAALTKCLRKELEWIPLMAMRKERTRRYQSASELAEDIRNYLNGDALSAGPESVAYRSKKFMYKHSTSIASATIILIVLIVALVVSMMMYFKAEQRAEEYRRSLYVNHIHMADRYFLENNISRVHDLLEACDTDLRGWEWYYLWRMSNLPMYTYWCGKDIKAAAISPDGRRFVTVQRHTIKVFDARNGEEMMTIPGQCFSVGKELFEPDTVTFSPDGKLIACSYGERRMVKLWGSENGKEVMALPGASSPIAFSSDGKQIVTGTFPEYLKIWDNNGNEVMTIKGPGQGQRVHSVAFNPDGTRLVSGGTDEKIRVWDCGSGEELITLQGQMPRSNYRMISVAYSPDGKRIVSGGFETIKVWDSISGEELIDFSEQEGFVSFVEYSPDGMRIISAQGSTIRIWNSQNGDKLMTLRGHGNGIEFVSVSSDGKRILSFDYSKIIKVWDSECVEYMTLQGHSDGISSIALSPDGKRIASGGRDLTIKVWDSESGNELLTFGEKGTISPISGCRVDFSHDGRRIVSSGSDKSLRVWDSESGSELMALLGHERPYSVKFSLDDKRIIATHDKSIGVWDSESGAEIMTFQNTSGPFALSPDGQRIACRGSDGRLRLLDVDTGAELLAFRHSVSNIGDISFSPDGKRIAFTSMVLSHESQNTIGSTIKVCDAESGDLLMVLDAHDSLIGCFAFNPDGNRIVSCGGSTRIWDADRGTELLTLANARFFSESVSFSPDGQRIVFGGSDTVKIWLAADAESVAEARQPQEPKQLVRMQSFRGPRGNYRVEYNALKWKHNSESTNDGFQLFEHEQTDIRIVIRSELRYISQQDLRSSLILSVKSQVSDLRILNEHAHSAWGGLRLTMSGHIGGAAMIFRGCVCAGKEGIVLALATSAQDDFEEYKNDIDEFMDELFLYGEND